jgi:DNA invertase Pin-like site-specific DNA recombinase
VNDGPARSKNDDDGLRTAVLYLRVSTKEQAERGGEAEGYSLPAQREACVRKAEALGAVVVDEFVERGESGTTMRRPELQRLLRYVKENPVSYVIVHKIDRLARNTGHHLSIHLAFKTAGAALISSTENIDDTPEGELMETMLSGFNTFY